MPKIQEIMKNICGNFNRIKLWNEKNDKEILFWVKYGRNIVKISAKK